MAKRRARAPNTADVGSAKYSATAPAKTAPAASPASGPTLPRVAARRGSAFGGEVGDRSGESSRRRAGGQPLQDASDDERPDVTGQQEQDHRDELECGGREDDGPPSDRIRQPPDDEQSRKDRERIDREREGQQPRGEAPLGEEEREERGRCCRRCEEQEQKCRRDGQTPGVTAPSRRPPRRCSARRLGPCPCRGGEVGEFSGVSHSGASFTSNGPALPLATARPVAPTLGGHRPPHIPQVSGPPPLSLPHAVDKSPERRPGLVIDSTQHDHGQPVVSRDRHLLMRQRDRTDLVVAHPERSRNNGLVF